MKYGFVLLFVTGCGRVSFDPLEGCTLQHLVDEPYANSLEGADGVETPFVVCTATQLARLGERPEDWDKSFVLGGDVDLEGIDVTPIGTEAMPFVGTFDGGGHAISHLRLDRPTEDDIGLFGAIDGAHLTNVVLHGVDISGFMDVGALLGYGVQNFVVDKVHVDGTVRGDNAVGGAIGYGDCEPPGCTHMVVHDIDVDVDVAGREAIGGVMGGLYNDPPAGSADLSNLHAAGHVGCTFWYCGGIIGDMEMGTLDNSSASTSMDCTQACGGAVGSTVFITTLVIRTFATGDVTCISSCGGLMGGDEASVEKSYATGRVQCSAGTCAGLVGDLGGHVYESYSTGDVIAQGDQVGGLVANMYGQREARDCFTSGHISGRNIVGGLIAETSLFTITRSYSVATVEGIDRVGGLVGAIGSPMTSSIVDSFAAGAVTGASPANNVSPLVGIQTFPTTITGTAYDASAPCTNTAGVCTMVGTGVTPASTFYSATNAPLSSWDFSTVWEEVPGSFPRLRGTP